MSELLKVNDCGIYCAAGDFYIDPWRPVPRAVVTHAHSDHARWGCQSYLTTEEGRGVLARRMGSDAVIETVRYGQTVTIGSATVSLHPAGHILGSAQVRVESGGDVWVVSGDYKIEPDPTCTPWEPVPCRTLVSECTFGLPIYRWSDSRAVFAEIDAWRRRNRDAGRVSVLFGYSLGKAQRLLAGVDPSIGAIYCHGSVQGLNADYRAAGIPLPPTEYAGTYDKKKAEAGALVVAPPSALGSSWMRRFGDVSTAFASGWMAVRGTRRRRNVDKGFVLSDHVDWPGLEVAVKESGAERVLFTHGSTYAASRFFTEKGLDAGALKTEYQGEAEESEGALDADAQAPDAESEANADAPSSSQES
ncbi:MAG TPA: ligase-associated DNA damage response exonuclease [Pirellulaceae bacterium]|jgi:putative mRNA 3-end processing factor|nr:ligase-associated DNA damage response exonuclease [Pirellulaceae bacterium]